MTGRSRLSSNKSETTIARPHIITKDNFTIARYLSIVSGENDEVERITKHLSSSS
jgi:hypothetical protein